MDRKEMKKQYLESRRAMGVFRILNTANGKSFVGMALDLRAKLNSHRAQLEFGSHMNKALQEDWRKFGPGTFEFEVLEELEPLDTPGYEPAKDLQTLEGIWVEKLAADTEKGYNPKSRSGS